MQRRTIVLLSLGAVAGVVAVTLVALPARERHLRGLAPLDGDEALLVTGRIEADGSAQDWLQLVRADGTTRWSREVSPVAVHALVGRAGVVATDDLVVVHGSRPDGAQLVLGLDRASGDERWESALPPHAGPRSARARLIVDGPRVLVAHRGPTGTLGITALALADGRLLWSRDLGRADTLTDHWLAHATTGVAARSPRRRR